MEKTRLPCTTRCPNLVVFAYSLSACSPSQLPVSMQKCTTSVSVIVLPADVLRWPVFRAPNSRSIMLGPPDVVEAAAGPSLGRDVGVLGRLLEFRQVGLHGLEH